MRLRTPAPSSLLAGALGLAVLAAAVRARPGPAPAPSLPGPTAYAYVVDRSGSTAAVRRRLLGTALAEIEGLPPGTRVVLFRMGSRTEEFYDGATGDAGADGIAARLAEGALPSDGEPGTDFPAMAKSLAAFSRAFAGRRLLVRVLTDGGDDRARDAAAQASYRRDAAALCADPRVAEVAFWGVRPGFHEGVRRAFGKAGTRLRILGPGQELGR